MTDNDKSSEIAERVRRKIAEELLRRGLDPNRNLRTQTKVPSP